MFRLVLNLLNGILNGENFAGITFTPKCLNFVKHQMSYLSFRQKGKIHEAGASRAERREKYFQLVHGQALAFRASHWTIHPLASQAWLLPIFQSRKPSL